MTLLCLCTVCSSPFRVSLMELKVRMTSDSSPCSVLSWLLLMEPPITLWPSKGFSASNPGPRSLAPPLLPEPPPGGGLVCIKNELSAHKKNESHNEIVIS